VKDTFAEERLRFLRWLVEPGHIAVALHWHQDSHCDQYQEAVTIAVAVAWVDPDQVGVEVTALTVSVRCSFDFEWVELAHNLAVVD